jgi:hypothetical protein
MAKVQDARPTIEPPAPTPAETRPAPTPALPVEPSASPSAPSQRQRLHEWIKGLDLDPGSHQDLVGLVTEMVEILAKVGSVEGTTYDPHEQIRFALEAAAKKMDESGLDVPIGVYARGTIKKRIGSGGYLPLADPSAKARAEATRRQEEGEAKEAAKRAKAEAEKAERAKEAVLQARWEALPEADREAIKARVRAENPDLGRWKNMLHSHCLTAMGQNQGEQPPASPAPIPAVPVETTLAELATAPTELVQPPAPTPPSPPILTDEQRAFLDGLTADQRARLDGCSPARLAEIMEADRIGVGQGERIARPTAIPPVPIPAPPSTVPPQASPPPPSSTRSGVVRLVVNLAGMLGLSGGLS